MDSKDSEEIEIAPRANLPGTKAANFFKFRKEADHIPFTEIPGSFGLQEFILGNIERDPTDCEGIISLPSSLPKEKWINVWILEHTRIFAWQLGDLTLSLDGKCIPESCPVMAVPSPSSPASKPLQFLCAAHKRPHDCCAIDYALHALDGTSSLLHNSSYFPSRTEVSGQSFKFFKNLARRLLRVFAHAFHVHHDEFIEFEKRTHLGLRFVLYCAKYSLAETDLIPTEELKRIRDESRSKK
ncbi:MOB kinase activator family like protein [Aduncisulcus paluster]|uniref:MOB kinase activator family like protein n=1 Tax=Aduncisulcus paluster TaxID=2918883 RepID=A0ABQ5JVA2_9EUKA|nr:MOB kinase activator family like protein [Aduncisulcus paluster]